MGKQRELNLYLGSHGGRRPKAGRRRIHSKGVAHETRETVSGRTPVHINFKFRCAVRSKQALRLLHQAILNARKHGLRINHYSLQSNHVHLIAEAADNSTLTKGMRSLTITFAKGLGKGRIQVQRYHLHVLRSVREAKNALHYVLFNGKKHGKRVIDEFSSLTLLPKNIFVKLLKEQRIAATLAKDRFELSPAKSYFLSKALT